jgi:hypothetical protein
MLSAILGVLNAAGKRVDAALVAASGVFRPVWLKTGVALTATAASNGQQETIVTLGVDVAAVGAATVTFPAVNAALALADASISVSGAPIVEVGSIQLTHSTIIADAGVTTTDATPVVMMSFAFASGSMVTIRVGALARSGTDFYGGDKVGRFANIGGVLTVKTALTDDVISDLDDIGINSGPSGTGLTLAISGGNLQIIWTGLAGTPISATVWVQATVRP